MSTGFEVKTFARVPMSITLAALQTDDLLTLMASMSSAGFGTSPEKTRYVFLINFVMVMRIRSTIEGYRMWIIG